MNILVTGGAGYIGSIVAEELIQQGDPATLIASSDKIRRELGWQPQYPELRTIVEHAWEWHHTHPHGYED